MEYGRKRVNMEYIKICIICNKEFKTNHKEFNSCSGECSRLYKLYKQKLKNIENRKKFEEIKEEIIPNRLEGIDRGKRAGWVKYMTANPEYFYQLTKLEPTKENIENYYEVNFNEFAESKRSWIMPTVLFQ